MSVRYTATWYDIMQARQPGGRGGTAESSASLSIQLDRVLAGLIDRETKWRSSVVSERC